MVSHRRNVKPIWAIFLTFFQLWAMVEIGLCPVSNSLEWPDQSDDLIDQEFPVRPAPDSACGAQNVSATDAVCLKLRQRIAEGTYPPETFLPSARDLAAELGAGRNTVAAAISRLVAEGLAIQSPSHDTLVLPNSRLSPTGIRIVHALRWHMTCAAEVQGILAGAEQVFQDARYGYEVTPVTPSPDAGATETGCMALPLTPEALLQEGQAFLFIETFGAEQTVLDLVKRQVPVVVANLELAIDVSAACVDHRQVMKQATEVLLAMGHRRIALLGRDAATAFYGRAIEGYTAALTEAGIGRDDALIIAAETTEALSGYVAIRPLLATEGRPTAVVCARDCFAEATCRAAEDLGLVLGRDLSVIGFDDMSWPKGRSLLTTFREPCREIGDVAARMLINQIVSGWHPPERRVIEAPLVLRNSVGPPPKGGPGTSAQGVCLRFGT